MSDDKTIPPTLVNGEETLEYIFNDIIQVNRTSNARHLQIFIKGTCFSFNTLVPIDYPESIMTPPATEAKDRKMDSDSFYAVTKEEWLEAVYRTTHEIIDSDKGERIIAFIRDLIPESMDMNFVLCNGESPMLVTPALIFLVVKEDNVATH